jgi:hypothetical protein
VTLRARWVTLRARWVTLRARWVTLRARWVTLRARWVTFTGLEGAPCVRVLLQRLERHCESTGGAKAAQRVTKLAAECAPGVFAPPPAGSSHRRRRSSLEGDAQLPCVQLPAGSVVLVDGLEGAAAAVAAMHAAAAQGRLEVRADRRDSAAT